MRQVTKEEFFAKIGPLDVHPCKRNEPYDDEIGYKTDWKLRNGKIVGYTEGIERIGTKKLFLVD